MKKQIKQLGSSFSWYNATQFLGALNDNIFKLLLIMFIIARQGDDSATRVTALAGTVAVIPFLLFIAYAGRLADRHSKRDIIVLTKFAEMAIMIFGCFAFWLSNDAVLYFVLFLMSLQSAFFGPCKYGIVRELVDDTRLARANGIIQASTYIAIIAGTVLGPVLSTVLKGHFVIASFSCIAVAAAGLFTSLFIERTKPAMGNGKASIFFVRDIWQTICSIRHNKLLFLAVLGLGNFSLFGAFIYFNIIPYGIEYLSLTKEMSALLFVVAGIGIMIGGLLAGHISGRGIAIGVIPIGSGILAVCSLALGVVTPSLYFALPIILILGIGAGLHIIPLSAYIQWRSPKHQRAEIIAAGSFIGWCAVLAASALIYTLSSIFGVSPSQMSVALFIMAMIPTLVFGTILFENVVRFVCSSFISLFYKITVHGAENIPAQGGTLIICNHVSYADPAILEAAQDRAVYFIMYRDFYNLAFLKPFCKLCKTVPISPQDSLSQMRDSIRQARKLLEEGKVVCIFPEGGMTRNGNLAAFKTGYELIVKGIDCQIIPAYIGGIWKSCFSYYYGKPLSAFPKKFRPKISVHFGKPLSSDSNLQLLRQKVSELSFGYWQSLKSKKRNLAYQFVKSARKNRHRRCVSDASGKKLSYAQTLTAATVLCDKIQELTKNQKTVGIMLPPSVGGVLTNIAVTLLGKVPVNLNYSASEHLVNSAAEKCGIKCVISSAALLEKFPNLLAVSNLVFIEDISAKISRADKIKGYLKAKFMPAVFLTKSLNRGKDDLATVIFSSGTCSNPKGVMLSHHNIISDIESMLSVFKLKPSDNLCAVLPFFHSFGFTCSLWLPIIGGASASFVPNPLDGKIAGKVARENNSTILFAAPTFLLNYIKRTDPKDFSNLRLIITGAEKLRQVVVDTFEDKFKIRPKEGYGATELSPVLSLNLPDEDCLDSFQPGSKKDTVGHPIPGCAIKIIDPQTQEVLPDGQDGLLMVKGPNVMRGYLDDPEQTKKVLRDGWYDTGDIARMDDDGFLIISDRLSRFSKIAGEMVPHFAIEEVLYKALESAAEPMIAVTTVPSAARGEELVVVCSQNAPDADMLHKIVSQSSLPNLWKPKKENYIRIKTLPALGSGKLDLSRIKTIAIEAKNQF
ncbi:MAG: acyl-[ACP]--phospholipid O-acyltransferase [Phycisphaerae bacterium]